MLKALYEIVNKIGQNMSEASRTAVLDLIDGDVGNQDETTAITNARLIGALIKTMPSSSTTKDLIKHRVLAANITTISALSLNSVLLESPSSLLDTFPQETPNIICSGISNKSTFIQSSSILASGKYLLTVSPSSSHPPTTPPPSSAVPRILEALTTCLTPTSPIDTRRLSLVVLRTIARTSPSLISPHLHLLAQPIFGCVRDMVIPVKLAAEAAFLALFQVVDKEGEVFEAYIGDKEGGAKLAAGQKRSMQDYFKRVALRLGSQARERRDAQGGAGGLGLEGDEVEDEREVWSVGKVDLGEGDGGGE